MNLEDAVYREVKRQLESQLEHCCFNCKHFIIADDSNGNRVCRNPQKPFLNQAGGWGCWELQEDEKKRGKYLSVRTKP